MAPAVVVEVRSNCLEAQATASKLSRPTKRTLDSSVGAWTVATGQQVGSLLKSTAQTDWEYEDTS